MAKYLDETGLARLWSRIKAAFPYRATGAVTVPASAWSNNQYTFTLADANLDADSVFSCWPDSTATAAEAAAWYAAGVAWVSQSYASGTFSVTLKAWGGAPTVGIKVRYRIEA
jgi:hypothetical protein